MTLTQIFLVSFLVIGMAAFFWWAKNTRARFILKKWAAENQFQLLDFKKEFSIRPFPFWKTSRSQMVFSVKVRDLQNVEKNGRVRCGDFWGGVLLSNHADAIWDRAGGTSNPTDLHVSQ